MIVFNNVEENHLTHLESLFKDADEAVITSPFLMEDLTVFFDAAFSNNLKKLVLYTTLPRQITDLIRKSNSLVSAFNYAFEQKDFEIDIRIVNNLHGKAYISYQNSMPLRGLIGSANLTNSGLTRNHEWGIIIKDLEDLSYLINEIKNLSYTRITEEIIIKILDRIEKEGIPTEDKNINDIDLSDIIDSNVFEEIENQIWLKPIGHTESPINPGQKFNSKRPKLHFSNRRPTGVNIDDILITYGVGARAILSVYKVQSEPKYISDEDIEAGYDERWPWYVLGENLTPEFGAKWWEYDLQLKDLRKEFLSAYPNKSITDAGTQSFGAFNFGADKLHLDNDFGNWLYNEIIPLDRS